MNIVLKLNNCATNDPCAICGRRTDPVIGLDYFWEGTWRLVCDTCAERYEPVLAEMRNMANKAFDAKQGGWPIDELPAAPQNNTEVQIVQLLDKKLEAMCDDDLPF